MSLVMSPELQAAQAASNNVNLAVNAAATDLFETFADVTEGKSRVEVLVNLQALTVKEFQAALKMAIKRAAKHDTTDGFVAPDDATGAAKYGPRELSLRSSTSQASQIWGALKQGIIETPKGFKTGVNAARKALKAMGVKWTGEKAIAPDARKATAMLQVKGEAIAALMQAHPEGYTSEQLDEAIDDAMAEQVSKAADKLIKQWEKLPFDALELACVRFLASRGADNVQAYIETLTEAL